MLEALSATGLRSIRYAKEVPGIKQIIANDLSSAAVKSIEENIKLNNVENLVTASEANATTLMYNCVSAQNRFDAIDLGKNKNSVPAQTTSCDHTFKFNCYSVILVSIFKISMQLSL